MRWLLFAPYGTLCVFKFLYTFNVIRCVSKILYTSAIVKKASIRNQNRRPSTLNAGSKMFSIAAKLKVMSVNLSLDADDEKTEDKVGLKIIAKTKWAPNVLIPMEKTFTLPRYSCAIDEELTLFLEVWEKDIDWGLDKLVGLAQYDLKQKFLKCSGKQDYKWMNLRNPVSNMIGGRILLLVRVDELNQQLHSVESIHSSSYFTENKSPPPPVKPKPCVKATSTEGQPNRHEEVIQAAQLQLETLGLGIPSTTSSGRASARKDANSSGIVQVDDIIEILNGKLGERIKNSNENSNSGVTSQGQGDWFSTNTVKPFSNVQTKRKERALETSGSSTFLQSEQSDLNESNRQIVTTNLPAPGEQPKTPRRRMAAVFTNMDYL